MRGRKSWVLRITPCKEMPWERCSTTCRDAARRQGAIEYVRKVLLRPPHASGARTEGTWTDPPFLTGEMTAAGPLTPPPGRFAPPLKSIPPALG